MEQKCVSETSNPESFPINLCNFANRMCPANIHNIYCKSKNDQTRKRTSQKMVQSTSHIQALSIWNAPPEKLKGTNIGKNSLSYTSDRVVNMLLNPKPPYN